MDAQQWGVLYIISCASGAAEHVPDLVRAAQAAGWTVCVIVTPHAVKFVNRPLLEQLTGYPVRSEYKHPEEPDVLPRADAIIVFPATFNTVNKWVLGISDTLALGLLCEYTGLQMPIVAVPCVRTHSGLDTHPAFPQSLERLRSYGVEVLYEPETYPPKNEVPPPVILQRLEQVLAARRARPGPGAATDQGHGAH
ncbi:flavoprotein [Thermogemmatispora carboxidivorans]|uniref:flavoprotein n=1 Tax=Thermogemmatispora carboxidivorans TaxID=1382306 RepID=UPI000699C220|nr:flavoprotein [Thermogemmatispora carboxidivorans]